MKKRVKCLLLSRRLTTSGLGDDGKWKLSDEFIEFPLDLIKEKGIIRSHKFKIGYRNYGTSETQYFDGFILILDGLSYYLQTNPLANPIGIK